MVELLPNKGPMGKAFKKEGKAVMDHLANIDAEEVQRIEAAINSADAKAEVEVHMSSLLDLK